MNEKELRDRVEKKVIHWNLYPMCSIGKKQMIFLEKENRLSKREAERLSSMKCIKCKICEELK